MCIWSHYVLWKCLYSLDTTHFFLQRLLGSPLCSLLYLDAAKHSAALRSHSQMNISHTVLFSETEKEKKH